MILDNKIVPTRNIVLGLCEMFSYIYFIVTFIWGKELVEFNPLLIVPFPILFVALPIMNFFKIKDEFWETCTDDESK